ncbi:hypothetical protein P378_18240 [Desulforamulus profundi]|uniref:Uncharacterized protein n=1 Tax=Desulforamulus profundi TaxID=1383067 RepID=A0A2C6L1L4_9FIRM|nr:hypothetical protein P378_18240 [Desulforamulus profundi]
MAKAVDIKALDTRRKALDRYLIVSKDKKAVKGSGSK